MFRYKFCTRVRDYCHGKEWDVCVRDDIYNLCSSTKNSIYVAPYSETERYPKLKKLNPNFHMAKTMLLPIFSLFLITLGHWLERKSPFRYTNIRFRYLFLKSRKHAPPKRILYAFSKLIMFLFIASTFDAKTPSKAHYDLEVELKQHCELFTDQYIKISEKIRSTN